MQAKAFINNCKAAVKAAGWTSGYSPSESLSNQIKAAVVKEVLTLSDCKEMHRKIGNAYPNIGTFTYTDGVVDYVLGIMLQPTPGVMPDDQRQIGMESWFLHAMGVDEKTRSEVALKKLKEYL